MSEFKIGTPVKLTGGGPNMTITSTADASSDGSARWWCTWYVETAGQFRGDSFPEQSLKVNVYAD